MAAPRQIRAMVPVPLAYEAAVRYWAEHVGYSDREPQPENYGLSPFEGQAIRDRVINEVRAEDQQQ